jgi:superfamily II DNA or RNA helicase
MSARRSATRDLGYYQSQRASLSLGDDALERLRPGQRGAVFAMRSWATAPDEGVAILGLPTGYGKSELITLAPFLFNSRRVLVIAPSVVVRNQLATRVQAQEHLRRVGIIPTAAPFPEVHEHVGHIQTPGNWDELARYDVVVSHTQSVSPVGSPVVDPPDPGLFDLLIFDEAHHLGAPSWVGVRDAFPEAVAIGFTATPYRRDRRALPGRTIFQYPIDKAVDEGFFVPITYREVEAGADSAARDKAVATEAIAELRRRDEQAGSRAARLLVRADTVARAGELAVLYREIDPGVVLEVITHETTTAQLGVITKRLKAGDRSGVAFVGVLGEGFDLPSLKIAAYHNPHRSLPVTIQFAGRVARSEGGAPGPSPEHAVLIATSGDHPEILAELHRDGQRWDRLIPDLARELGEGPARAWTVPSADTADMAAAFSVENFRTFMLADVYRLGALPNPDVLAAKLAQLHVTSGIQADHDLAEGAQARDSASAVRVIRDGLCFAALLARQRQLPWLDATPVRQPEYDYIVLAIERNLSDGDCWWLCVRSTLPPDMTANAVEKVIALQLGRPSRSELAQYRGDKWRSARFTGLGKRAIHPVVAGVLSYETGAGRGVDHAVTLDDRALHEIGHAIGVVADGTGGDGSTQIGIAMDKRRVWQTGYARLPEYAVWSAAICRELEGGTPVLQLGGLRVADSPLDPTAKPIAADFAPFFDANWDAEYQLDGLDRHLFSTLTLDPLPRPEGADVQVSLCSDGSPLSTIIYAPDGQLLVAPGDFLRRGRSEGLLQRLVRHPISVFFDNGSIMRGPGGCIAALEDDQYFAISNGQEPVTADMSGLGNENRFVVLDQPITLLPEKDGTEMHEILGPLSTTLVTQTPASLFQFAVRQSVIEQADFVFCDDSANEIADFIVGWRSYPGTGTPHLRLVHCKAMIAAERRRLSEGGTGVQRCTLEEAEEICQQVLRSVAFLLRPPETMHAQLESRAENQQMRWVLGDIEVLDSILSVDILRRTSEIWAVHPGMSRGRLLESRGRRLRSLFSAVRVRAVDARTDLALLGRA